jgi:hypothetical protein
VSYQKLTVNLGGGTVRYEELEGRRHMVVPASILAEGIIQGSAGPVFYSANEIGKGAPAWNHKPVVIGHPHDGENFTTACRPEILNTRKVGILLNSLYSDKLRTECWLDEKRLKSVSLEVYNALTQGRQVECSTGLFADGDGKPGKWKGKRYTESALHHRPDHLAILTDAPGAYSVADGGGLLANQFTDDEFSVWNRNFSEDKRKALAGRGAALPDGSYPVETEQDLKNAFRAFGRAKDKTAVKRHVVKRARALGLTSLIPEDWKQVRNEAEFFAFNELSFGEIGSQLQELLASEYGEPGKYWSGYVCEVYADRVIFRAAYGPDTGSQDTYWMVGYKVKNDVVALEGDAVEVEKVFQEVGGGAAYAVNSAGSLSPRTPKGEESPMPFEKKAHISALIANGGWAEADRPVLEAMPDSTLEKIKLPAPPAGTPPPNTQPPPADLGAFVANAPAGVRDVLQDMLVTANAERARLVDEIVKYNPNAPKDLLMNPATPIANVRFVHSMIPRTQQLPDQMQPLFGPGSVPVGTNYTVAAGAPPVVNTAPPAQGQFLGLPTMTFDNPLAPKK